MNRRSRRSSPKKRTPPKRDPSPQALKSRSPSPLTAQREREREDFENYKIKQSKLVKIDGVSFSNMTKADYVKLSHKYRDDKRITKLLNSWLKDKCRIDESFCEGLLGAKLFGRRRRRSRKSSRKSKRSSRKSRRSRRKSRRTRRRSRVGRPRDMKKHKSERGCKKQSTKKYSNRPSPPFPANLCRDQEMKGNDRKMYKSVRSKKQGKAYFKWKKM